LISKSSDSLVDRFPGGELERVLSLLREHNLALLTLILHLMVSRKKGRKIMKRKKIIINRNDTIGIKRKKERRVSSAQRTQPCATHPHPSPHG
jgi:hypothetical protein